jgi:hypothetical protein
MSVKTSTPSLPTHLIKLHPDFLAVLAVTLFGLVLSAVMLPLFDPQAAAAIVLIGP